MDSPGVLRDILFILVPLRAGREDEHFLYHSDTHLLSVSANKAPRAAFCAVEMDNGFSLPFPMKKHTKEIFCHSNISQCYCGATRLYCRVTQYTVHCICTRENVKNPTYTLYQPCFIETLNKYPCIVYILIKLYLYYMILFVNLQGRNQC